MLVRFQRVGGNRELKLIYGGYGSAGSGKQYVYWGADSLRTGQTVVAPVEKNGKIYNTMLKISRTSGENREMAQNEARRVEGLTRADGTPVGKIKSIEGADMGGLDTVGQLPGGAKYKSKAEWKRASDTRRSREQLLRPGRVVTRMPGRMAFLGRFL